MTDIIYVVVAVNPDIHKRLLNGGFRLADNLLARLIDRGDGTCELEFRIPDPEPDPDAEAEAA